MTGPAKVIPMQRRDWTSIGGMVATIAALHLLGWGALVLLVEPQHANPGGSTGVFGVGLGATAYVLGLRHAFDADHITAIDNTTRKLVDDGRRPLSVGFWFSLGHSTVVFVLCALLSLGVRSVAGVLQDDGSTLRAVGEVIGTSASGAFLVVIGLINLVVLVRILRMSRKSRCGDLNEGELRQQLEERGLLNRWFGGMTRAVRAPWQVYPLGVLFGLGFDTFTEVALLVLAGGAAAFSPPWYAILTLPVLFAAGMSLLDAVDGVVMNVAYGWALHNPVRKLFYNVVVTALSVATALAIGLVELGQLLAEQFEIRTGPLAWTTEVELDHIGYGIAGGFALLWLAALVVHRHRNSQWTELGTRQEQR